MVKVSNIRFYLISSRLHVNYVLDQIKVSRQVDGTAGDTSDEDGSDISDDQ